MTLRVLHVYAGNLYGGIERFLVSVAASTDVAAESGLVNDFALCFPGRLRDELLATNAKVHPLGGVRRSRFWTVWLARRRLRKILEGIAYDVVVCHAFWPHVVFAPAVRAAGVPLVFWNHDTPDLANHLDAAASKHPPDLAVTNSVYTRPAVTKLFPGVPVVVRYCAVAFEDPARDGVDSRRATRAELATPLDAVVIVMVARMEPWKGHELLLTALHELPRGVPWRCWIVGGAQRPREQAYFEGLKAQARRLGVETEVRFLGQRSDVPRLMHAADVYCQPNTGPEPFGISFVEALHARLTVVTTALGAAPEILADRFGILVPPDSPHALAAALARVAVDPAERARYAQDGPGRAHELCSPSVVLPDMARIFRGLLADPRRG